MAGVEPDKKGKEMLIKSTSSLNDLLMLPGMSEVFDKKDLQRLYTDTERAYNAVYSRTKLVREFLCKPSCRPYSDV